LIDTWLLLRDIELGGERNRGLYVLKSRGMKHSNQIREFLLTDEGVRLVDVYSGPDGVLTGSMRVAREAARVASARSRSDEAAHKRRELERKKKSLEAQLTLMTAELEAQKDELARLTEQGRSVEDWAAKESAEMTRSRGGRDRDPR
jgi:circadian clock protein KaiC